ncbi:hypothetical protein K474DRAFT_1661710 [Panus rudis PR-1116 ss-1]|nr:hypothetical protein K474DRAFT_1661710 [Panus rudis PR-1116 ss-1]
MAKRKKTEASTAATTGTSRATASRRQVRGKRGGLQDLPNMPLDIIFEVFKHLQPLDLLNLARTSKAFRRLLLSKSAAIHWKAARKKIPGLPECPNDMSEPAYASLLFDTRCQSCLKANIPEPLWMFRKRYCNDCRSANTVNVFNGMRDLGLNRTYLGEGPLPLPHELVFGLDDGRKRHFPAFHKADFDALITKLASMTAEEKEACLNEMQEKTKVIEKHAIECRHWVHRKKLNRQQELNDVRETRFEAIVQKLREEGWGPEVEFMDDDDEVSFDSHPLADVPIVRQPKPLTSRGWLKVFEGILPLLQDARRSRLKRERRQVIRARLELLGKCVEKFGPEYRYILPRVPDLAVTPACETLIRRPSDMEVTEDMFNSSLRPILGPIVTQWERNCKEQLAEYIRKTIQLSDEVDPLRLAIGTYFTCKCMMCPNTNFLKRITWPHTIRSVLTHPYRMPLAYERQTDDSNLDTVDFGKWITGVLLDSPWSVKMLEHPWVSKLVAELVEMCGMDPASTTADHMDDLHPRFTCKVCHMPGQYRRVMGWRAAVSHVMPCTKTNKEEMLRNRLAEKKHSYSLWRPGSTGTADLVSAAELHLQEQASIRQKSSAIWHCSHCSESTELQVKSDVLNHLRVVHQVESPGEDNLFAVPTPEDEWRPHHPIILLPEDADLDALPQDVRQALQEGTAVRVPVEEV